MWRAGFKWMYLIMGTTIGAGYVSGREIWQFFGAESGLAIAMFTVMFSICCFVIMKISFEERTEHFFPVLKKLVGRRISYFYDGLILIYLFSTTVVMLAGGGVTLEIFQIPYWVGIGLIVVLIILLFVWDLNGLVYMNAFILPLLVGGLAVTLVIFMFDHQPALTVNLSKQSNWPSAFTFTALNILPLIAVLSAVGKQMKHMGEAWIASIGSGMILGGLSFIYNESLLQMANEIMEYEIPLFGILRQYPYTMFILMTILLWTAIYTTAASGIFGLTSRFRETINMPLWVLAFITLLSMVPFTKFGFSDLIAFLYPLYGVLNLYILVSILLYPIVNRYKWE
jgi:uncharacterized membrane protein YkvI